MSRYKVASVTGYSERPGRADPPKTSYYVLDTAYCHRIVAVFAASGGGNRVGWQRRHAATSRARALNEWDAAEGIGWSHQRGEP